MDDRDMHQHGDVGISVMFGTALSLAAHWLSLIAVRPAWIGQLAVTVLGAALATIVSFAVKRFMRFIWPDKTGRRAGDTGE